MTTSLFFRFLLCSVAFTCTFAGLNVLSPPTLQSWWAANSGYTHTSEATFGYIPWGRKIMGTLSLANPIDACEYIRQDNDNYVQHQIIVAVRGNCTFVTKAHYAQLAGAKMLLIADNAYEDVEEHLMVDFMGQGDSVTIPTVLIHKMAGDKFVQSLQYNDPAVSKINVVYDFALERSDNVEYHVWLSSATSQSFKFMNEWRAYDQKLGNYAKMVPHYAHFSAPGQESQLALSPNCLCGGRYCAPDPDDERDNTGADVLIEDLRQMCLYKNYPIDVWWNYVQHYDSFCLTSGTMNECGRNQIINQGISYDEIQRCIDGSFGGAGKDQCTTNKYFEDEQVVADKDGIFLFPSVIINGFAYRGSLSPPQGVFEAICETFNDMPAVCKHYLHVTTVTSETSHAPVFISAAIFLVLFSMFVFCCYRRYLKRELHKQMVRDVNIAVSQYIAFKDQNASTDKDEDRL